MTEMISARSSRNVGRKVYMMTNDDGYQEGVYMADVPERLRGRIIWIPAIWCQVLQRVVFGYECWWSLNPDHAALARMKAEDAGEPE